MIAQLFRGLRRSVVGFIAAPSGWGDRTRKKVVGVLGLLLIASVVALGFGYKTYSEDEARAEARRDALATATKSVAELLTYDSKNVEDQFKAKYELLTGKFKQDFMDMSAETIIPLAKEQNIATKAQVAASGVISSNDDRVDVLLFVNQSTQRGGEGSDTALQGSRVKVGLVKSDGKWSIDGLTPV
ncbi:hypothetical protein [Tsukamurella paurometabola]|uniref:Mce-associated membrane protein n=1 Tax=Tsukamurella paurometabola TaxID=2061 RepID=A0ABS5NGD6_TSUPA|nr:hypothetical protein [Tsukamurella paurometabola]MBS4102993.1 hypothetical protein [Tsukamurella paurometabola]